MCADPLLIDRLAAFYSWWEKGPRPPLRGWLLPGQIPDLFATSTYCFCCCCLWEQNACWISFFNSSNQLWAVFYGNTCGFPLTQPKCSTWQVQLWSWNSRGLFYCWEGAVTIKTIPPAPSQLPTALASCSRERPAGAGDKTTPIRQSLSMGYTIHCMSAL